MPDREPNFNDRLQAMAARALLLAAKQSDPTIVSNQPEMFGRGEGPIAEQTSEQVRLPRSGHTAVHTRDLSSRHQPAGALAELEARRRLRNSPRGAAHQMLLDRQQASSPVHPATLYNRRGDEYTFADREGLGLSLYPQTGVGAGFDSGGRQAFAQFAMPPSMYALDPSQEPVSQGPPVPGYDAERDAILQARRLAFFKALYGIE